MTLNTLKPPPLEHFAWMCYTAPIGFRLGYQQSVRLHGQVHSFLGVADLSQICEERRSSNELCGQVATVF